MLKQYHGMDYNGWLVMAFPPAFRTAILNMSVLPAHRDILFSKGTTRCASELHEIEQPKNTQKNHKPNHQCPCNFVVVVLVVEVLCAL